MDYKEGTYDSMCYVVGEVVLRLAQDGRDISREEIVSELAKLDTEDLGVVFAVDMLRR